MDNGRLELVKLQAKLLEAIDKNELDKAKIFKNAIVKHLKLYYGI